MWLEFEAVGRWRELCRLEEGEGEGEGEGVCRRGTEEAGDDSSESSDGEEEEGEVNPLLLDPTQWKVRMVCPA